jgi:hypothetical protein
MTYGTKQKRPLNRPLLLLRRGKIPSLHESSEHAREPGGMADAAGGDRLSVVRVVPGVLLAGYANGGSDGCTVPCLALLRSRQDPGRCGLPWRSTGLGFSRTRLHRCNSNDGSPVIPAAAGGLRVSRHGTEKRDGSRSAASSCRTTPYLASSFRSASLASLAGSR